MRLTQADHIIYAISMLRPYWNGGKGLEVEEFSETGTANIKYNGTNVGYVIDDYEKSDYMFMVLTLQKCMLPDRVSKQLAHTANDNEIKVVFVPMIDIGFGITRTFLSVKQHKRILNKVAQYSQDDVKTAAMMGTGDHVTHPVLRIATAYTYNQTIGHTKFHAEATLAEFASITEINPQDRECWFMDLEPCENCLQDMIDQGARSIVYMTNHKEKWNTEEYLELVDQIHAKIIRTPDNYPVIYKKEVII